MRAIHISGNWGTNREVVERGFDEVFTKHLLPLAAANPGRPIVFTEYYAMDTVETPADPAKVPLKAANKGAQAPAESPEGRASTKGNSRDQSTHRTQGRDGVSQAVKRIRQAATRAVCRQPPKVGAVCVNAHVRI